MRQKFTKKNNKVKKRGRQRIRFQGGQAGSKQAESGIHMKDRTTGKIHRTIDDNPSGDKGKTDTIYRGGNGCTTSDSNETRVAEGR